MGLPQLIVFDLDFTLWDCGGTWCDCLRPGFSMTDDGRVVDASGRHVRLYPDVHEILDWCDAQEIKMGLASRTHEPAWARALTALLGIDHRFIYQEIYPSSKLRHFSALEKASGLRRSQMLFFDDEQRNIDEVGNSGCCSVRVDQGLCWADFRLGLSGYDLH